MADEQGPIFGFGFEGDDDSARREADRMTKIIGDALGDAFKKIGPQMGRQIARALSEGNKAYRDLGEEAKQSAAKQRSAIDDLIADQDALRKRIEATRAQLSRVGAEPELFAIIDREFQRLLSTTRDFTLRFEDIVNDPDLMKGFETNLRNSNQIIFRELAGNQSVLRNLAVERGRELNRLNAAEDRAAQERLANLRAANSRYVVETQGSNAQLLAETRAASQQRLQAERIAGRTRIELVRFTYQQIRVLERGIAAAFRGTASVLEGTIRTLQRGAARIGNLFRRTNADLNEGLGGALLRREQTISRSFNRQTRQITSEVTKQSAVIQRFEAQASTGIAGALSGRSSLGALLGGGLAIGGGVGFVAGIRNQIKIGGDFVQGLAVMQAQLKLTDETMLAVRQQSIELGNDISLPGVSALDAAEAIQILGKQFASFGAQALPAAQAAARGVLQLSRAMGVQSEEAARVVGASVNVFGAAADQATNIADQITNAMSLAAGVGFNDFADAFTQSASVVNLFIGPAQDATDALAELNAAVATLAKGGIIGSDAGTSIKQFFLQANRGTVDSVEVMNELTARAGETGTAFFDAAGDARTLAEAISILERGTRDLSDQARTQTLQKLFGSDAARAAAILIDQGAAAFRNLTESVKEQGSAARIAAAQNTGLRGALDALQSVIETQQIKTYERYQKQLGNVVVAFAELLNAFFEGEGIFRVIRASLLGLGVALGGLLAAKAAAESIRFLAIAMGGLVTPLGLVVGGLAVLGAAIGGLSAVSPEFRAEMGKIRDDLRGRFGEAIEFLADSLARLIGFVRTEALPPFVNFAVGVARRVLPVIEAAANQIDLLGGAFRSGLSGEGITSNGIIGFMERLGVGLRQVGIAAQAFRAALGSREFTTVLTSSGVLNEERQTAFVRFAERLGQAVGGLRSALRGEGITSRGLVGFGERVGVALRQAAVGAEAFKAAISGQEFSTVLTSAGFLNEERQTFFVRALETLGATLRAVAGQIVDIGSALRDVFTGDRTVGSILTSIGQMFSGTFTAIVDVLGPQLDAVVDFIGEFLSGAASTAAGTAGSSVQQFLTGPFQQAAAAIGFFLGNLVSDPRLVEGVEKLIGLALLTGVNFAKGLFQGIGSNLDELAGLFGRQLLGAIQAGLKKAFDPVAIAKFIVSTLGAVAIGAALFTSLRRQTDQAGNKIGKGFISSLGGTLRTAFTGSRNNPFAAGLFGGFERVEEEARRRGDRVARNIEQGATRQLQALRIPLNIGIDQGGFRNAREQLDDVIKRVGAAQVAGATIRGAFNDALGGVRIVGRGIAEVMNGIRKDFADKGTATIRTGLGQMSTAVGTGFTALRQNLKASGIGLGQALGGAIVSGVGAALSGQALGTATGTGGKALGLAGVISSALFAGASVGGGPQGIAVGGFVAAIGLVSAAFASNKQAADEAKAAVKGWADALRDTGGLERVAVATDRLEESFRDLDLGVQEVFRGFDFSAIAREALDGSLDMDRVFERLARGAGASTETIAAVRAEMDRLGIGFDAAQISIQGGGAAINRFKNDLDRGISLEDFNRAFGSLVGNTDSLGQSLRTLDIEGTFTRDARAASGVVNDLATAAINTARAMELSRAQADRYVAGLEAAAVPTERLDAVASRMAERAVTNLENVVTAIDAINRANVDNINARIGNLTSTLEGVRTEAALVLEQILAIAGGPGADPFEDSLDNLLLTIPQIAPALQTAFANGTKLGEDTLAGAEFNVALAPLFSAIQTRLQEAINIGLFDGLSGAALDAAQANLFAPFLAELDNFKLEIPDAEGNITVRPLTEAEKQVVRDSIQNIIESDPLDAGIEKLNILDEAAADLQAQLDALQAQLQVDVVIDPEQVQDMLASLGLPFLNLKQIQDLIPFSPNPNLPITDTLQGGGRITDASLADIARLVAEGRDAAVGRPTVDTLERSVVNNTVNQTVNYATAATEVPVMSPADAQRANRAAATGLLAILPGTRS